MAAKVTRQLEYIINGRDQSKAAFGSVERSINRIGNVLKSAGAAIAAYFSIREISRFAKDSLLLASNAEEAAAKFEQVFGTATESATNRLDAFSVSAGRSRFELREMAGDFGALLVPMGLTEAAAADMSVELSKLSTDLASFFNTSDDQARTALRAGLVGESEPLRKYGVQLSALRIEQEAFATGIGRTGEKLTAAQKAQAAFNIIMADTAKAQGDAIRTGEGFANQVRNLQGEWVDFKTELGDGFLPVATEVLNWINDTADGLGGLGNAVKLFTLEAKSNLLGLLSDFAEINPSLWITEGLGLTNIGEREAQNEIDLINLRANIQKQLNEQDDRNRAVAAQDRIREQERLRGLIPWEGPLPQSAEDIAKQARERRDRLDELIKRAAEAGLSSDEKLLKAIAELSGGTNSQAYIDAKRSIDAANMKDEKKRSPFDTGSNGAVAGNFITGLAQATRSTVDVQKKSLFAIEENKRINAETRDILRSIRDGQGSGVQLVGGVFN